MTRLPFPAVATNQYEKRWAFYIFLKLNNATICTCCVPKTQDPGNHCLTYFMLKMVLNIATIFRDKSTNFKQVYIRKINAIAKFNFNLIFN